jgi:hypothetical protein
MSDTHAQRIHEGVQREESAIIERDLKAALGWKARLPKALIRRMGLEVIYQRKGYRAIYRGIRRNGKWIIDHNPELPFIEREAR